LQSKIQKRKSKIASFVVPFAVDVTQFRTGTTLPASRLNQRTQELEQEETEATEKKHFGFSISDFGLIPPPLPQLPHVQTAFCLGIRCLTGRNPFALPRPTMRQIPFVVDVTRTPNETTDTLPDGKKIKGIDKLDGDTLTSCVLFFALGIPIQNPKSKIQNCLLTRQGSPHRICLKTRERTHAADLQTRYSLKSPFKPSGETSSHELAHFRCPWPPLSRAPWGPKSWQTAGSPHRKNVDDRQEWLVVPCGGGGLGRHDTYRWGV
jgi:hypothetical protein